MIPFIRLIRFAFSLPFMGELINTYTSRITKWILSHPFFIIHFKTIWLNDLTVTALTQQIALTINFDMTVKNIAAKYENIQ